MTGSRPSWRGLAFLLCSAGGMGLALSTTITMLGFAAFSWIQNDRDTAVFGAWSAGSSVGIGLALVPGTYWALRRILGGKEPPARATSTAWLAIALLLPLTVWVGHRASQGRGILEMLVISPAAHIATALAAAGAIVALILSRGPPLSARRASAAVTIGLTVIPLMAVTAEALILIPATLLGAAWLLTTPEGVELVRSLVALGSDPAALSPALLEQWLQRPAVVASVFAFTAGIVPVVEELAKSAAVWPWLRRPLTPAHGFLVGALAGAGYGLFEALLLSQPGPEWAATAIGRIGAALMHSATAGITGWGLMEWAHQHRWRRALAAYAIAVAGHAAWNLAALAAGYETLLRETAPTAVAAGGSVAILSTFVLAALSLTATVVLARRPRGSVTDEAPKSP